MLKTRLVLRAAAAVLLVGAAGAPALAFGATPQARPAAQSGATFLVAQLNGDNEVSADGTRGAGDPDGHATELLRIQGDQVTFAVSWTGIGAPTAGHVHQGAAGTNGAVVIPFFGAALPATLTAVQGTVTVTDAALLASIQSAPQNFYANLHTAEFPSGAVRGQLHRLGVLTGFDVPALVGPLAALENGANETPAADPDGRAVTLVRAQGQTVDFAMAWTGIGAPTASHIHQGAAGTNGAVVVPFFSAPGGLPTSITAVAGTVPDIAADLVTQINQQPANFYANVHPPSSRRAPCAANWRTDSGLVPLPPRGRQRYHAVHPSRERWYTLRLV
jgi:hypothetical protein